MAVYPPDASQDADNARQAVGIQQNQQIGSMPTLDVESILTASNTVINNEYFNELSVNMSLPTAASIQQHFDALTDDSNNTISGNFFIYCLVLQQTTI